MLTHEETRVLSQLRARPILSLEKVCESCLPGASPEWVKRVLSNLEWLGYVVVYYDEAGEPSTVQTTERGMQCPA